MIDAVSLLGLVLGVWLLGYVCGRSSEWCANKDSEEVEIMKWNRLWTAIRHNDRMLVVETDPDIEDTIYIRDAHDTSYCLSATWNGEEWMTGGCDASMPLADCVARKD